MFALKCEMFKMLETVSTVCISAKKPARSARWAAGSRPSGLSALECVTGNFNVSLFSDWAL